MKLRDSWTQSPLVGFSPVAKGPPPPVCPFGWKLLVEVPKATRRAAGEEIRPGPDLFGCPTREYQKS